VSADDQWLGASGREIGEGDLSLMILVTGGNGFIGRALAQELGQSGLRVRTAVRDRREAGPLPATGECIAVGDVGPGTDWSAALKDVETVVHLAARVHNLRDTASDPATEYRRVNVLGSVRLAHQCIERRVRRLVFVSTIGVHGNATGNRPLTEANPPSPAGHYAASKWEAEQELRRIAGDGGLELVVVRPPAVYGPGAKGNVERLLQLVSSGWPLPLGGISAQRSFIGLGNLVDFLKVCVTNLAAAGETFVVCDGTDMSSRELIRRIEAASGKSVPIWYCPRGILRIGGVLLGQKDAIERLCTPLRIDAERARRILHWKPPQTVDDEIGRMVEWWTARQSGAGPSNS